MKLKIIKQIRRLDIFTYKIKYNTLKQKFMNFKNIKKYKLKKNLEFRIQNSTVVRNIHQEFFFNNPKQ